VIIIIVVVISVNYLILLFVLLLVDALSPFLVSQTQHPIIYWINPLTYLDQPIIQSNPKPISISITHWELITYFSTQYPITQYLSLPLYKPFLINPNLNLNLTNPISSSRRTPYRSSASSRGWPSTPSTASPERPASCRTPPARTSSGRAAPPLSPYSRLLPSSTCTPVLTSNRSKAQLDSPISFHVVLPITTSILISRPSYAGVPAPTSPAHPQQGKSPWYDNLCIGRAYTTLQVSSLAEQASSPSCIHFFFHIGIHIHGDWVLLYVYLN